MSEAVSQTGINQATHTIGELRPLSQQMGILPLLENGKPRSSVYTEKKIRNDYEVFFGDKEGYNPNKPIEGVRRELLALYETGEVTDIVQALEWAFARSSREWDGSDFNTADWFIDQSQKDPKLHQPSEEDIKAIVEARNTWRKKMRGL